MQGTSFFAACITSLSLTLVTSNSGSLMSRTLASHCKTSGGGKDKYLRHRDGGSGGLKLVQKQFEVANNHKLPLPAFLDPSRLGDFDVPLIRGADTLGGVYPERSLGLVWGDGTHGRHSVLAPHVTREPAHLAHHALQQGDLSQTERSKRNNNSFSSLRIFNGHGIKFLQKICQLNLKSIWFIMNSVGW